ncbi:MAG: type 1 glutamine amidotransferase domain-containing protein, partial [Selenomonadaceae bacterium]
MMKKKVLMVVTNVNTMEKDHPTGLWLEEFAVPYLALLADGYDVTVASPLGGKTPLDPNSVQAGILPQWQDAAKRLEATEVLSALDRNAYAGVILPG